MPTRAEVLASKIQQYDAQITDEQHADTESAIAKLAIAQLASGISGGGGGGGGGGDASAANQLTGNATLASINTKTPVLGQATELTSTPVVLPASQVAALTPPAAIVGFATELKQDTLQSAIALLAKSTEEQPVKYLTPPEIAGYNPASNELMVGTSENKFRDEFFSFDTVSNWEVVQTGAGQVITTNGILNGSRYLNISSGTTASQETIILSRKAFKVPNRVAFGISISQRIVNQDFFIELVSVDGAGQVEVNSTFPAPILKNALNLTGFRFNSTTATSAVFNTRTYGKSEFVSSNTSFVYTTAATGTSPNFFPAAFWEVSIDEDKMTYSASATDSQGTQPSVIKRNQQIVDPNKLYKIRIRVVNSATPPASSTDLRIHFVKASSGSQFTVDFARAAGRNADIALALPTFSTGGTVGVTGSVVIGGGSSTIATISNIGPGATGVYTRFRGVVTNTVQTVKAAVGNLYGLNVINESLTETCFVKIFDAAIVTLGTTNPNKTYAVYPNTTLLITPRSTPFFYCQTNSIKVVVTKTKADNAVDAPTIPPIVEIEYI